MTLFSVPSICKPLTPHPLADSKEKYLHLSGLELADDPGRLQRGTSGPVAIQTCLGWVLSGPVSTLGEMNASHNLMTHLLQVILCAPEAQQPLEEILKSFWGAGVVWDSGYGSVSL